MQTNFELTPKQAEFIRNANHRWNVACGAVRSGKSYCQISYCIPSRLTERKGLRGLRVILGATRANIERNILQPMRDLYGDGIASGISSQNTCKILGEKVYCIGADNVRQVSKIRGSEIAYCAIDEATDISEEVFEMLKSRLSLPWSCCDITTNPSGPHHWFKSFLDSREDGVDIYLQEYTIYDNLFLPKEFVKDLEKEYYGTVYYKRYILGMWALAEGLIYPMFGDSCIVPTVPRNYERYVVSMDYGIQNPTAMLLWGFYDGIWYQISEYYHSGRATGIQKTDQEYYDELENLAGDLPVESLIIDPSATSFIALVRQNHRFKVRRANNEVLDGIQKTASSLRLGFIKVNDCCIETIKEYEMYSWDPDRDDTPIKNFDHAMDATRYFVNTMRLTKKKREYGGEL